MTYNNRQEMLEWVKTKAQEMGYGYYTTPSNEHVVCKIPTKQKAIAFTETLIPELEKVDAYVLPIQWEDRETNQNMVEHINTSHLSANERAMAINKIDTSVRLYSITFLFASNPFYYQESEPVLHGGVW